MKGFLPAWIAIPLTERYNNLIDFSFFGRTSYNKGIFSYSRQQLLDRAYVWGGIIIGAAATAYADQSLREESAPFSLILEMIIGACIGGYITHEQIMRPKIYHRKGLIKECNNAQQRICHWLEEKGVAPEKANPLFDVIHKISAKTDEQANATMTLVNRKQAMNRLEIFVNDNGANELKEFFSTPLENQWATINLMKVAEAKRELSIESANPPQASRH